MKQPFIVAELSANHNGSLENALLIVEAAARAGADAIKLQTWEPDTMCLDRSYTIKSGKWKGRNLFALYREAHTPWNWHKIIFDHCKYHGIECFSAPFDKASVDFLETLGCPRYKIASFELVDIELIRYAASKGKPMVLSTGMASLDEIKRAGTACWYGEGSEGKTLDLTYLQCTSAYPADASDANLLTMKSMNIETGRPVGLSDHTLGIGVAVAAVALGAVMIEKHLKLARADGGLDASFSMEPHEFAQMVTECRRAASAIGTPKYGCGPNESTELRRSLYWAKDINEGEMITAEHLRMARPSSGLPGPHTNWVGTKAARDHFAGEPTW